MKIAVPGGEPGIFFLVYFLSLKQRLRPRLLRPHKSREEFKITFVSFSLSLSLSLVAKSIIIHYLFLMIYEDEEFYCLHFSILFNSKLSPPKTFSGVLTDSFQISRWNSRSRCRRSDASVSTSASTPLSRTRVTSLRHWTSATVSSFRGKSGEAYLADG